MKKIHQVPKPVKFKDDPKYKEKTLSRDFYQCRNPGCSDNFILDVHHIWGKGQGGPDLVENCITLCRNCHGKLHFSGENKQIPAGWLQTSQIIWLTKQGKMHLLMYH